MSAAVASRRAIAKSSAPDLCNRKTGSVQPISAVMQKVKDSLPAHKPALHLHLLTDLSISYCEKLLCGQRQENAATLTALLRSPLGRDVLFALMDGASPDWFGKYKKQLDLNAARAQLRESQRAIEALQAQIVEGT